MLARSITVLSLGLAASFACAHASDVAPANDLRARPSLLLEGQALVPGKTAVVAITFEIQPKWHLYWPGQNDSGLPVSVELSLPEGYMALPLEWPTPVRHLMPGDILDYVYFDRLTILQPIQIPASAEVGKTIELTAKLSWLVCEEVCVPEEAEVRLSAPIAAAAGSPTSQTQKLISEARSRLPRPVPPTRTDVKSMVKGNTVSLSVNGASLLAFYPEQGASALLNPIPAGQVNASKVELSFDPESGDRKPNLDVRGILEARFEPPKPPQFFQIRLPEPKPERGSTK